MLLLFSSWEIELIIFLSHESSEMGLAPTVTPLCLTKDHRFKFWNGASPNI